MDNFDFDKLIKEISAGNVEHDEYDDSHEHKKFKNNQCPRCGYRLSKEQFELWSVNTTDEQREELDG